ncbi:hypothetical protein ACI01nite_23020 [Acetobacter cibinongensis]|uniref:Glutathionylspermidine synthase pre-ATP-grasp-like domain-containing protein n=1 Tax=Acetobacter cibinongensis TaxID=146475 RepID=A0A0D6N613_9PROT|nr:glutathionylspermidine synthase family protein [Acetobacter cibinongensis]GAN61394.1 hypothetical protein Abci_019_008 [Acetobacter cibinongensis]GBQ14116.1 glutathionylspermidine synthase [Acetobacter cibinongensis NRIC 0482]GEL59700.1 hypothetical protein ACI01nite_23020 [Acetobacter cibinongensis]
MPPGLRRQPSPARPTWRETAYKLDYRYFVNEDKTEAWREDACYVFTPATVSKLAAIAEDLHRKALAVVRDAVEAPDGLTAFHVPQDLQNFVRASWRLNEPFMIGRFDFAWHNGQPKLIEYNADTPATLPESSQMQQQWHREVAPHTGQFPLDEARLIHRLRILAQCKWLGRTVHVVPYPDNLEDATHARYYQRWLALAGLDGVLCELRDLEISRQGRLLHRGRVVDSMIRMYPWELMLRDEGARHLAGCGCLFLNPPWVSVLSNKVLLPALWQRYPHHPALLPASWDARAVCPTPESLCVEKPIHARGGENIRILQGNAVLHQQAGTYGSYPKIYQAYADQTVDGVTASIGVWIIGGRFAGLTMRESHDPIIRHSSAIVPHCVQPAPGLRHRVAQAMRGLPLAR